MAKGIEIDKKVAEESLIPGDLNSLAVGSYVVPNPKNRKKYSYIVLSTSLLFFFSSFFFEFVNFLPSIIILIVTGSLLLLINNNIQIKQGDVIKNISNYLNHSIGYYSIALTFIFNFKNILTPIWTVIVYSHENPPISKSIIEINAFNGNLVSDPYTENINA